MIFHFSEQIIYTHKSIALAGLSAATGLSENVSSSGDYLL